MQEKKQGSKGIIICLIIMVVLLAAGAAVFILGTGPARNFSKMNDKAIMCINNKDYEGAVDIYRQMLEIAPGNDTALSGLNRAYALWADYLDDDDEPELAAEVMEEEADYLAELNDRVHSKRISRMIQEVEQNAADYLDEDEPDPLVQTDPDDPSQQRPDNDPTVVLESAYLKMGKGDYKGMLDVDGSVEADDLVQLMKSRGQDVFIFGDDYNGEKDYTGQAVALYIIADGYYFYYGDFVDGIREGYGTSYWKNGSETYEMYQGYWKDDAPNGQGAIINRDEYADTTATVSGEFLYGHQDGDMSYDVVDGWGMVNHGEYKATDGDAPEIKVSGVDSTYYSYGYTPYVELTDGTVIYYYSDSEYLGALGYRRRY